MALLIVSIASALTAAGNSVLTASVFHGLAATFGLCECVLHVTRHSTLTRISRALKLGPAGTTRVSIRDGFPH